MAGANSEVRLVAAEEAIEPPILGPHPLVRFKKVWTQLAHSVTSVCEVCEEGRHDLCELSRSAASSILVWRPFLMTTSPSTITVSTPLPDSEYTSCLAALLSGSHDGSCRSTR